MGLFSKDTGAEKRLKELTGGFILSEGFRERLKEYGLSIYEGVKLCDELKIKIKEENMPANNVADELTHLLEEKSQKKYGKETDLEIESEVAVAINNEDDSVTVTLKNNSNNEEKTITVKPEPEEVKEPEKTITRKLGADKWLRYALNQESMLRKCSICNSKTLKEDKFCYSCGVELPEYNTLKKIGKTDKKAVMEETVGNFENSEDTLKELEQLYSKKISEDYSTSFKFAYALFLNQVLKNPTKKFSENFGKEYDTNLKLLKKQATSDNFIKKGSPLLGLNGAKVKDMKEVLKEHDLKVSGNKTELIERIGENLTPEEIKKAFPIKSLEVTEEGLKFLENNKHIFIYTKTNIKYTIPLEKYDELITENEEYQKNPKTETVYQILLKHYKQIEKTEKIREWYTYNDILSAVSQIYENLENDEKHLEYEFKKFIICLNKYAIDYREIFSIEDIIKTSFIENLIKIINNLNYDINQLKTIFHNAYTNLNPIKIIIHEDDALIYLLKIFNGEKIENILKEIKNKY